MERQIKAGDIPSNPDIAEVRARLSQLLRPHVVPMKGYHFSHIDEVVEINGIRIMERIEKYNGLEVGCAEYVFWYVKRESWCEPRENPNYSPWDLGDKPYYYLPIEFWRNAEVFLRSSGYMTVDEPQEGDVVAYRDKEKPQSIEHFGVYVGEGRVISKPGQIGHVYEHEIWQIPEGYGNEVIFFRKLEVGADSLNS